MIRKSVAVLMSLLLLFCTSSIAYASNSIEIENSHDTNISLLALSRKSKSSTKNFSCVFTVATDIGVVPSALNMTSNMFYDYDENSDGRDYTRKITLFVKVEPYTSLYSVNYCHVVDINVNGYSLSMTRDTNVMVSPGWVWDNRYADDQRVFAASTSYSVNGRGTLSLSGDCIPSTHTKTNTINMH